jgi:IS5 family transposase
VECIGKGKASAPYEFGVKASLVTTHARAPGGQFVLHARALSANPYDGHTLRGIIDDTQKLTGRGKCPEFSHICFGLSGTRHWLMR